MENISTIRISLEMIDSVAQLHMVAFDGYTNTLVGIPYVRAFIRWFCETNEAIALCAVDSANIPMGYAVGAPLGYAADLNKKVLWPAVMGILFRPWLAFNPRFRWIVANRLRSFRNGGRYQSNNQEPILPSPTISLVGIGVHPRARGQGVGQKLLAAFEISAIESKAKSMRLSVYPDRIAARNMYTKADWKSLDEVNGQLMYYYKLLG